MSTAPSTGPRAGACWTSAARWAGRARARPASRAAIACRPATSSTPSGPSGAAARRGEDALLASAYRSSLELAAGHGLRTIAFPAISTGAYGFPLERATRIAVAEVRRALEAGSPVERVVFCCFSAGGRAVYDAALAEQA